MWQMEHRVEIPEGVIEENTPTRECLNLAQELVWGYTQTYPEEWWPLIHCEEPLQRVLTPQLNLLAKVDSYFYVPTETPIPSGIPGVEFTLSPGWWVREYKTKTPYTPIGIYMQAWEMGMQASYQYIALGEHLRERGLEGKVAGILVAVLEKPIRHIPRRKCQTCQESYEFATWIPTGTGLYCCPVCGVRSKLLPLKENPSTTPPNYYQIPVVRTDRELERDLREISMVGETMLRMETGGLNSTPWHHGNCVDLKWKRACEYFGPHRNFGSTLDDPEFEAAPEYRGLPVEELVTIE